MKQVSSRVVGIAWLGLFLAWELTRGQSAEGQKQVAGLKYEEPRILKASIYAAEGQQLLFNFTRMASRSNSTLSVHRDFKYPDGRLAAQERVVYEGDELISCELDETQIGAGGSVVIRRNPNETGTIEFSYKSAGGQTKTRTEPLRKDTLMADMVGPFLADHWRELSRGESVNCRYLVVQRRETVGFTFAKTGTGTWQGQPVTTIRMQVSSRLLSIMVDPLFFSIQNSPPHRVLRYTGRTTPKVQAGTKWKDLDALTVFDWQSAR